MVTAVEFAQTFRRTTKECAATLATGEGIWVDRLEIREVGDTTVEAWSPDGQDFITRYWLDETSFRLGIAVDVQLEDRFNGVWEVSW
jgi:hypothetical protein